MARRGQSSRRTAIATSYRYAAPRVVRFSLIRPRRALLAPVVRRSPDLRTFHPERVFRPLAAPRSAARVVVRRNAPFRFPDVFRFAEPRRLALCVRREERRQVLHALGRVRSGRGRAKHRNALSNVSCRR